MCENKIDLITEYCFVYCVTTREISLKNIVFLLCGKKRDFLKYIVLSLCDNKRDFIEEYCFFIVWEQERFHWRILFCSLCNKRNFIDWKILFCLLCDYKRDLIKEYCFDYGVRTRKRLHWRILFCLLWQQGRFHWLNNIVWSIVG